MSRRVDSIVFCAVLATITVSGGRADVSPPPAPIPVRQDIPTPAIFEGWVYPTSRIYDSVGDYIPRHMRGVAPPPGGGIIATQGYGTHALRLATDARFADVWKFYAQRMGVKVANDFSIDIDKAPSMSRDFLTDGGVDGHPCSASATLSADLQEGNLLQDTGKYSISVFITHSGRGRNTSILLQAIEK